MTGKVFSKDLTELGILKTLATCFSHVLNCNVHVVLRLKQVFRSHYMTGKRFETEKSILKIVVPNVCNIPFIRAKIGYIYHITEHSSSFVRP